MLALLILCTACSSTVKKQTEVQANVLRDRLGNRTKDRLRRRPKDRPEIRLKKKISKPAEDQTEKQGGPTNFPEGLYLENKEKEMKEPVKETVPLTSSPVCTVLMPSADGLQVYSNSKAAIDASHLEDGYVMVKVKAATDLKLKVIVTGPSQVNYTYNLNGNGGYEVFPLSDGDGSYKVGVYQNISGRPNTVRCSVSRWTLSLRISLHHSCFQISM